MCGIAGFTWENRSLVRKMASILSHRGPDDQGFYVARNISLGHRRLSIIDLSKKGHQPMLNQKKSLVLIFNGEIWNYKELRENLMKKGYKFKGNSDTETILYGYEEYGEKICSMLDGMFTFAIWDLKKKSLFLARDKMGKKPLYYFYDKEKLIFASEIKAILLHDIQKTINSECLSDYLSLRFSPNAITIFKDIKKLPPGSYGVYRSGKFTISKYYSLPKFESKFDGNVKDVDNLIADSIKKRLISDVPIGVFLSGGLDSSSIVAYMSRFSKNIHTFSVGFKGASDESRYAQIIAKKFKTTHKEIRLDNDILKYLPEVIYHLDEPLADPAALPTFLLSKEVSKYVKVALSGEGGDEVFGGYHTFNYIPYLESFHKLPSLLRKEIISPISNALSGLFKYPRKQMFLLLSEISTDNSIKNNFKRLFYFPFDYNEKRKIFSNALQSDHFDKYLLDKLDISAQEFYFNEWLPNDLLMKADKTSMASSLEVRTPYLDKDLINYFSKLRYSSKRNRKLFRKTVSPLLPQSIMKKKKQGFTLPISEWFSDNNSLRRILPFIERLKERDIFNKKQLEFIINNPKIFRNDHRLWVLLNFEIWYEIYIEGRDYKQIKV